MNEPQQRPGQIQLNQQQIAQACATGLKLLNDDERVNIPPSMAKSGDLMVLDSILTAVVKGESVMITAQMATEYEALKKAEEIRSAAANNDGEGNED